MVWSVNVVLIQAQTICGAGTVTPREMRRAAGYRAPHPSSSLNLTMVWSVNVVFIQAQNLCGGGHNNA